MAGGQNAQSTMCPKCFERAERVTEGIEDDHYECPSCGARFGIDWSEGQPESPCWPPTAEERAEAQRLSSILRSKGRIDREK
jgi:hypothetical protein